MSAQNREKLTLPLVRKMSTLAIPTPPEVFCIKKCGCASEKPLPLDRKIHIEQTPNCGHLLWTTPYMLFLNLFFNFL